MNEYKKKLYSQKKQNSIGKMGNEKKEVVYHCLDSSFVDD
jgi:hypothetical protein